MSVKLLPSDSTSYVEPEIAEITMCAYGPGLMAHNMPCAVFPSLETALFNADRAVFEPSAYAQKRGWQLVRVKPGRMWLFELMCKFLFV